MLPGEAGGLDVHVGAEGAAVHLRGAQVDQLVQDLEGTQSLSRKQRNGSSSLWKDLNIFKSNYPLLKLIKTVKEYITYNLIQYHNIKFCTVEVRS